MDTLKYPVCLIILIIYWLCYVDGVVEVQCEKAGIQWDNTVRASKCIDTAYKPAQEEKNVFLGLADAIFYDKKKKNIKQNVYPLYIDERNYPENDLIFQDKKRQQSPEYVFHPYMGVNNKLNKLLGSYQFKINLFKIPITRDTPIQKIDEKTKVKEWKPEWEHVVFKEIKNGIFEFPYRIIYEKVKMRKDILEEDIIKILGKDGLNDLKNYVKYLFDLENKQKQNKQALRAINTIGDPNTYLHFYHPRQWQNHWEMFIIKEKNKYFIPLLMLENDKPPTFKNNDDFYKHYDFKFFTYYHNKLQIFDKKKDLLYTIWWFPQILGQCVYHATQAMLQDKSLIDSASNDYESCHIWVKNAQLILNKNEANHNDKETYGKECQCIRFNSENERNKKDIANNKQCRGGFSTCFFEEYLVSYGYNLFTVDPEFLKQQETGKDFSQNLFIPQVGANFEPLGIVIIIPGHIKTYRKITPTITNKDKNANTKRKFDPDNAIWVNLDSGYSPKRVNPYDIWKFDKQHKNGIKDITHVYLIYPGSRKLQNVKGWIRIGSNKFTGHKTVKIIENKLDYLHQELKDLVGKYEQKGKKDLGLGKDIDILKYRIKELEEQKLRAKENNNHNMMINNNKNNNNKIITIAMDDFSDDSDSDDNNKNNNNNNKNNGKKLRDKLFEDEENLVELVKKENKLEKNIMKAKEKENKEHQKIEYLEGQLRELKRQEKTQKK